ncbi:hypothetical protein [Wocania ichthyoenteri]|uniref:hypothetical protein n=1 Tax=Wocania ichthyoenteri TaxID=1230531 RepID=UPI0012E06131|nr:hypothetical protein [Wocania ichthyoenteri]
MKKLVTLVSVVVVILILNLDRILVIDDYFKAIMLFVLAGFLAIFEYKRNRSFD